MLKQRIERKLENEVGRTSSTKQINRKTEARAQEEAMGSHKSAKREEAIEAGIGFLANTNGAFIRNKAQGADASLVQVARTSHGHSPARQPPPQHRARRSEVIAALSDAATSPRRPVLPPSASPDCVKLVCIRCCLWVGLYEYILRYYNEHLPRSPSAKRTIRVDYDKSNPAFELIACSSFSFNVLLFVYLGSCTSRWELSATFFDPNERRHTFSKLTHVLAVGSRLWSSVASRIAKCGLSSLKPLRIKSGSSRLGCV